MSLNSEESLNKGNNIWLHFRKLRKKESISGETRRFLLQFCSPFGPIQKIVVMHGRGQALVAYKDPMSCSMLLESASWPYPVTVEMGRGENEKKGWDIYDQCIIETEVSRCISSIIRRIVTDDSLLRHRARQHLKNKHKRLVKSLKSDSIGQVAPNEESKDYRDSSGICWEYVIRGCSQCSYGPNCKLRHRDFPIHKVPLRYRVFECEDAFPQARELSPMKTKVNQLLVKLSASLSNKRCLVLDGSRASTVRHLLTCPSQLRKPEDMVVPNYCSETYTKLLASGLCFPFLGSLRAYLDSVYYDFFESDYGGAEIDRDIRFRSRLEDSLYRFGIVYLDYCCRITSGYKSIEKSPIADIERLFKYEALSRSLTKLNLASREVSDGNKGYSSILAVCLCQDDEQEKCKAFVECSDRGGNEMKSQEHHQLLFSTGLGSDYAEGSEAGVKTARKMEAGMRSSLGKEGVLTASTSSRHCLRHVVDQAAQRHGYLAEVREEACFSYGVVFVDLFYIYDAE